MTTDMILSRLATQTNFPYIKRTLASVNNHTFSAPQHQLPEVLFMTSFPPRECGLATYSQDLINALDHQFENSFQCVICALESDTEKHVYDHQPRFILNTDERNAFAKLAFKINHDPMIKLVVIQHEFGFFARKEEDFAYLLSGIEKPIIFVFHTVLPSPNQALLTKVQQMAAVSKSVIVMTRHAADILMNDYAISARKITVIPHGTHLVPPLDQKKVKTRYHLSNRSVLSTFGLLGSSKSIETTLDALPNVIKVHPEIMFLILGKTHPSIVRREGEQYRSMLEKKVIELKLEHHVRFVNEYLPLPKLLEYLQLTDIYLFTSNDPNQAVSGTFSYAVSSGCPVISTPIPHAREVLNDNNGIIIDFGNAVQLSNAINSLLENDALRAEISSNSFHKMAPTAWQNTAIAHALLFQQIVPNAFKLQYNIPELNLNHIRQLTTSFGMIQFARIAKPDLQSGYTLDDNARALIAMMQHYNMFRDPGDLLLIHTYFQFIKHCLQPDGLFLNYVDSAKEFTSQNRNENLEDSHGRAIWALGYLISKKSLLPVAMSDEAAIVLQKVLPHLTSMHSTRAMAFIIKGLYLMNDRGTRDLIKLFANRMVQMYKHETTAQWHWFENCMTYGNSLLPEAMLVAYLSTNHETYKKIAKESFDFLLAKIFVEGKLKVISNNGWQFKNNISAPVDGGEQPIDVAYTMLALETFYRTFKHDDYMQKAIIAFNWFLGENHLHRIVYNPCTGGCYDGVEAHSVNLNQGAESTLSYLLARLTIERMLATNKQPVYMKKELEIQHAS